ncbi:MAG: hypothetical protein H6Q89_4687, partial [Myxococcaceae bacterium]|nr:hypothetical protein [Myxococcaceae bacterium]
MFLAAERRADMDLSLIGKCLAAGALSTVSMDLGALASR